MSPAGAKIVVTAAFLVLVAAPLWWDPSAPRLPIGTANGVYASDCCGSIALKDGLLTFAGGSVRYVVEDEKGGRYVLPEHLVHVTTNRVDVEEGSFPLMMQLDGSQPPRALEVPGYRENYTFSRAKGGSVR